MIQTILRTAVAAVLFAATNPAQSTESQSTGRSTEPRERTTRSHPEPRPKTERKQDPAAKPAGESKPTDRTKGKSEERSAMTPAERARCFMEKHPEVRARLFAKADADGDGELNQVEREQMKTLVMTAMRELKEHAQEQSQERQEKRTERREERRENIGERMDERAERRDDRRDERQNAGHDGATGDWDIDGSGRITPREKIKERADRNDDGHVGPRERQGAQEVREKRKERTSDTERSRPNGGGTKGR